MSWITPANAVKQMRGNEQLDNGGSLTLEIVFKAPYATLKTAAEGLVAGDVIETGWSATTWHLSRIPGGYGELTINCIPTAGTEQDPDHPDDPTKKVEKPLEDLFSLRSVRNDVSVMAYCGPSAGANPLRADLEMWMKETDRDLYSAMEFKDASGATRELTSATKALAAKIQKGVQSVMRFYPILTRTRIYAVQPPKCLEKLGYIDTPPTPGTDAKKPGGVDTAINAHQWLKCQDDVAQRGDRTWSRTESWMGIAKSDGEGDSPWDPDLYGPNRWTMPADPPANPPANQGA